MNTKCGIDYLSTTILGKHDVNSVASHPAISPSWRDEHKGMIGYTNVRKCVRTGLIEAHSPTSPRMGTFVQYSGDTLAKIEVEPIEILFFHWLCGHNITRLDVCVDIHESALKVDDLIEEVETGMVHTTAREVTQFSGVGATGGSTLYIGSPRSTKRLRIYDKAAEQGIDAKWVRVELQLRKDHAQQAAHEIALSRNRLATMSGLITAFADFENEIMRDALEGEITPLKTPRKETRTRHWLMTQVTKAMSAYILDTNDDELLDDFIGAVRSDIYEAKRERRQVDRRRNQE